VSINIREILVIKKNVLYIYICLKTTFIILLYYFNNITIEYVYLINDISYVILFYKIIMKINVQIKIQYLNRI